MLPRLDAEEKLGSIDVQALAYGAIERDDAGRILTRLECARDGIQPPEPERPKPTPEALAAMGIAVTIVDQGQADV